MKKLDLVYMAGIFDGEGCIHIGKPSASNSYSLHCSINIANRYIPDLFKSCFGGNTSTKVRSGSRWSSKQQWRWQVSARLATAFLETILPYLRLKKVEAELGITFQKEVQVGGTRYTSGEKARKEALYWQMRNLKKGETNDEKTNTV